VSESADHGDDVDRVAVERVEVDAVRGTADGENKVGDRCDFDVRHGEANANTGGDQLLAGKNALEKIGAVR